MKRPANTRPECLVFDSVRGYALEIWRNRFVAARICERVELSDLHDRAKATDTVYLKAQTAWCVGIINDEKCRDELMRFHREAASLLREIEQ